MPYVKELYKGNNTLVYLIKYVLRFNRTSGVCGGFCYPLQTTVLDFVRSSKRRIKIKTSIRKASSSRRQLFKSASAGLAALLLQPGLTGTRSSALGHQTKASGVIVPFDFGCARQLYERRLHPRLLVGPEDLGSLRDACRRGWCQKVLASLRVKVEPLIAEVLAAKDLSALVGNPTGARNGGDPRGQAINNSLDDIVLVGLLENDDRALEAGRRVLLSGPASSPNNYNVVFGYDLIQPHLSAADRRTIAGWLVEHMRRMLGSMKPTYLESAGSNIGMAYMLVALTLLLAIDGDEGVPDLAAERSRLLLLFEAALYSSIGEGGYPEEDIGYGTLMTGRVARVATCLRRAGLYDAYRKAPRFTRFGRAMLHFVQPWGMYLSNTGDHGDDFGCRDLVLAHLARYNNDPTLIWLMTTLSYPPLDLEHRGRIDAVARETELADGLQVPTTAVSLISLADAPQPIHPAKAKLPTAFVDRDRGIVSFRSGWKAEDTFVYLDGSQRPTGGQGHAHDSGGHFALSALGEYFAVGPGRFGMDQDQHNVMLVDGKSGRTTDGHWRASWYQARLIDYRPDPFCDYAAADNTQQANCHWSWRHLGLVKPVGEGPGTGPPAYVWTVDDVNGAYDFREFWWTLHSEPGNTIEVRRDSATIHGRRRGGLLDVHFAFPPTDAHPQPHTLELAQDVPWTSSHKYIKVEEAIANSYRTVHHATYFRPRLIAKLSGLNGRLMAVMTPRKQGSPEPKVEALPTVHGSLAMRLTFTEVQDTLIWAFAHQLLEADGIRGRGRWVVVRRLRKSGRVIAHALGQGDWLEIDGRAYPVPARKT